MQITIAIYTNYSCGHWWTKVHAYLDQNRRRKPGTHDFFAIRNVGSRFQESDTVQRGIESVLRKGDLKRALFRGRKCNGTLNFMKLCNLWVLQGEKKQLRKKFRAKLSNEKWLGEMHVSLPRFSFYILGMNWCHLVFILLEKCIWKRFSTNAGYVGKLDANFPVIFMRLKMFSTKQFFCFRWVVGTSKVN